MNQTKIQQVVLWGCLEPSCIFQGFYKAFQHMGYNTWWLEEDASNSNMDWTGTLFLVSSNHGQAIPCRTDCYYVCFQTQPTGSIPKENVVLWKVDQNFSSSRMEKVDFGNDWEYVSFGETFLSFHSLWASDLLPMEIEANMQQAHVFENNKDNPIFHVGTFSKTWSSFKNVCDRHHVPICHYESESDLQEWECPVRGSKMLSQNSKFCVSLQDADEIICKYIPCSVFRHIGFGRMVMTNNYYVFQTFSRQLIYGKNVEDVFQKAMAFERTDNPEKMKRLLPLMATVRDHHTYINRIQSLQSFLKGYTRFVL